MPKLKDFETNKPQTDFNLRFSVEPGKYNKICLGADVAMGRISVNSSTKIGSYKHQVVFNFIYGQFDMYLYYKLKNFTPKMGLGIFGSLKNEEYTYTIYDDNVDIYNQNDTFNKARYGTIPIIFLGFDYSIMKDVSLSSSIFFLDANNQLTSISFGIKYHF